MPLILIPKEKEEYKRLIGIYNTIFEDRIIFGWRGTAYRDSEEFLKSKANIKYASNVLLALEEQPNQSKHTSSLSFELGYKALKEIKSILKKNIVDEHSLSLLNISILDKVAKKAKEKYQTQQSIPAMAAPAA